MNSNDPTGRGPADDDLAAELANVDEMLERVRLAGLALAAPLTELRRGQMAREAARAAVRFGGEDPEARARASAAAAADQRFAQLRTELARARVSPAIPSDDESGVAGVITRGGEPLADATVSLLIGDRRGDFACTNSAGGFALRALAETPFRLSVSVKAEGEVFRDRRETTLKRGQTITRHVEIEGAGRPCREPEEPASGGGAFPMVQLRGQLEPDARRLIAAQDLVLAERREKEQREQAGRVIGQTPRAGAKVMPRDAVSIVVATDGSVEVPLLLGLSRNDARLALAKSELSEGKVGRKQGPPELVGRVATQAPEPGARARRRSDVDLEIGVARRGAAPAAPSEGVARVARLAGHRLSRREGNESEATERVEEALRHAKVRRPADLEKLIEGKREQARERLGFRTLAEADRLIAALRWARKELDE